MIYEFRPQGVCSQQMRVELDDQQVIQKVEVLGGCSGNLQAISRLVEGLTAAQTIEKLRGIRCGSKPTSCPDQLARGLEKMLREHARQK